MGLWTFPAQGRDYWQHMPIEPLGVQRESIITRIQQFVPSGRTPLYAVTRTAVETARASAGGDTINAVVVMTDGKNENPEDTDIDGLVAELGDQAHEDGIRVFTIAYGQDADLDILERISEASRAAAYDATDPLTINAVFANVLSNF